MARSAALAGTLGNKLALELGKAGEHGQDQAAVAVGGVRPGSSSRLEAGAGRVHLVDDIEKIPVERAVDPAGTRQDVTGA